MWNYRIVKVRDTEWDEWEFGIYEVYYDDVGRPNARTEDPVSVVWGEDTDKSVILDMIKLAFGKPVLEEKDFINNE